MLNGYLRVVGNKGAAIHSSPYKVFNAISDYLIFPAKLAFKNLQREAKLTYPMEL